MLRIEIFLSLAAILWAFAFPRLGSRWFGRLETGFSHFAQRRGLSIAAIGILAVLARVAVLPILPVPTPAIHDEFSYLLMADTFAHGRLANPTHPMWLHFETFHVNQVPAYVSKYYPAQGIFLAIGQVIFGHPFWGVVLSCALMCAAICWMLQGWMPPSWALLGGLLAVVRIGTFSYWANSYWGGAVAALGGALVLGALPRIKGESRVLGMVWMGIGAAILFNSRPYEALFLMLPVATPPLIWLFWHDKQWDQKKALRVVLPLIIAIIINVAGTGLYCWKTTGHPFRPPYLVYERTYSSVPIFPWVPLKPAYTYRSSDLRNFYEGQRQLFNFAVEHPLQNMVLRIFALSLFYLGPVLIAPFLMLLLALPVGAKPSDISGAMRLLLLTIGISFAGMALPFVFLPHYAAPVTALIFFFLLSTLKYIRPLMFGARPVGWGFTRAIVVACVLLAIIRVAAPVSRVALTPPKLKTWASENYKFPERPAAVAALERLGGLHLVFVAPQSQTDQNTFDWVYNAADIDASKVVWARDLGHVKNQELIDYYHERKVWIIDPTEGHSKLTSYPMISQLRGFR